MGLFVTQYTIYGMFGEHFHRYLIFIYNPRHCWVENEDETSLKNSRKWCFMLQNDARTSMSISSKLVFHYDNSCILAYKKFLVKYP
jgi:hypothetical protein